MITTNERQSWADACRVAALVGAVVIHACGGIALYSFEAPARTAWLVTNFVESLVRCSVPLFVMLSGALLLRREAATSTPRVVGQRVLRIAVPLLVWSFVYVRYVAAVTGRTVDGFQLFREPVRYHLWFVYMMMGIYLALPWLEAIYRELRTRRDLQAYLLVSWFVVNCLPSYFSLPGLGQLQPPTPLGYGGYFLLGALLVDTEKVRQRSRRLWFGLYAGGVLATFFLTWALSERSKQLVETAYSNFSPNVVLASVAAFVLLSGVRVDGRAASVLRWASDRVFVVYLMHVIVVEQLVAWMRGPSQRWLGWPVSEVPVAIRIAVATTMTLAVCFTVALVLRKLPKAKAIFG